MGKILGLDLGTNSIGWAIRDTDEDINQIIDYGVVVFEKGVGDGKSGEFSLAAERRKNRSKRRLYNAKRYRKWATLKVLMQNDMCPITDEELKLWSIGDWKNYGKNNGRVYPTSPDFKAWLAMDFERIGKNISEEVKLKPAFSNTYLLRCDLLDNFNDSDNLRKYKIGRALYHLAQRRGFKTSRKSGKSSFAKNEELEKLKEKTPNIQISQVLQNKLETENKRIRASGVIQRKYFEDEFRAICSKQNLSDDLSDKLYKAIYYVRPLKTQKGIVGKCTLEKGKTRIPISHPAFEEFRALSFINNIQWREAGSKKEFKTIPMPLKKKIFEELFFRRLERGKNKSKVDDRTFLKFDEIIDTFSENNKWEFNYKNKPNVSTCPVIAGLMNVFDEAWKDKFYIDENRFGINWQRLIVEYKLKYGKLKRKGKGFISKNAGDNRKLDYDGVWHLLFDFIQIKDKEDDLKQFCKEIIGWNDEKAAAFSEINIQQGYGSLSQSALNKILPFLQEGYIYSEAVSFANLSKVLGKDKFKANKKSITASIANTIKEVDSEKEKLNIVNGLIQQYFAENNNNAKGIDNQIKEIAAIEVEKKLRNYFGELNWSVKPESEQKAYFEIVLQKYLVFLDGKQKAEEKASYSQNKNPEIDYYKLPRLDTAIKRNLKENFAATDEGLKHLYHPSDIDIYPKAKKNKLEDPQPPSKGWKNPMAMRTMYELKRIVNYLLEIGKIDVDTKIIIEMARELNDANKRWAIQTYQKRREEQNIEFAKAILGVAKEKYPKLNENDADNIDKVRLWWEQSENGDELYKDIKTLKEDVQKYKLWKEQQCQCIYTGNVFSITDLFDGTKTQFEHTLPLSDSFDNSLANLTVCDAYYNTVIKKNQLPTQLKNYDKDWNGYTAIKPRLKKWMDKRDSLKERIGDNKIETQKANRRGDIERKNDLVKQRHLLQFEFDYWDKKVKTFTLTELPNWWKNSQLVDTQIISKYARAYMKSLFPKVDVQKGSITSEFRKIFEIMGDEKKDRSRHSHHAVDAAVLTLIPGSARREEILKQYYKALETGDKFHVLPYPNFNITHVTFINDSLLINHVSKDQTLTHAKKKVRKRGKVQFTTNKDGEKVPIWMTGDSVRGQLHKETYFGAIKINERNEQGYPLKKDGRYLLKQANQRDEIWIVSRKPIDTIDFKKDIVVDELLKKHLIKQIENGIEINELRDFNNKKVRHLRCRVKAGQGFLSKEKAIELKKHSHPSKLEHKKFILAQNSTDGNYLYLFYEKEGDEKTKKEAKIINLFEFANYGFNKIKDIWNDNAFNQTDAAIPLKYILKVGQQVAFYSDSKEELKELELTELNNRVFKIYKFNDMGSPYIYLQNHIEARMEEELEKLEKKKDGYTEFNKDMYQYRLKLKANKLICVFEGIHFNINADGKLEWLF